MLFNLLEHACDQHYKSQNLSSSKPDIYFEAIKNGNHIKATQFQGSFWCYSIHRFIKYANSRKNSRDKKIIITKVKNLHVNVKPAYKIRKESWIIINSETVSGYFKEFFLFRIKQRNLKLYIRYTRRPQHFMLKIPRLFPDVFLNDFSFSKTINIKTQNSNLVIF